LALAVLMPEEQAACIVKPQEELGIGGHLGLHDQCRPLVKLRRGWQEQTIEPHFPLLDHRRGKRVALHVGQNGGHQGEQALGALLEQPEEKFVAGDHRGLRELIPSSLGRGLPVQVGPCRSCNLAVV
jgi:hypothetical protein